MKNLKFIFILLILTQLSSCNSKSTWKTETFKTESGWGYTISNSGKVFIKQSVIPVVAESKSFKTKEDALKTANFVLDKILTKNSPSITENELQQLNIIGR